MFGGRSSNQNSLGDEMFANFLALTSTPQKKSPKMQNDYDEKPLLGSRRQAKDPEPDFTETRGGKPLVVKTTASLAQKQAESNLRPRKQTVEIPDNQLDDILADILDRSNDNSNRTGKTDEKAARSRPVTPDEDKVDPVMNDFAQLEDDNLFGGYDPSTRSNRSTRRSQTATNLDLRSNRPQTGGNPPTGSNIDDIGEINITVSRRRPPRGLSQGTPERPFTSPGKFEEGQTTTTEKERTRINFPKLPEDEMPPSENTPSNSTETRPIRGIAHNSDQQNAKTRAPSPMPIIADRSSHEDNTFRDQGSPGRVRPGISRQQSLTSPLKVGENNNTVIVNDSPLIKPGGKQHQPSWEAEAASIWTAGKKEVIQGSAPLLQNSNQKASNVSEDYYKNQVREIDEDSKKKIKEAENYYEKRFEALKLALLEEKSKWEELHNKEVDNLKKDREELKTSMQTIIDKERERARDLYKTEMETKEKMYKFEIEKQRVVFDEQYKNLKTQFESQAKLNSLADEIRNSSTKIMVLTDQMELNKNQDVKEREIKISEKERELSERERWLGHEREILNLEKIRMAKAKEMSEKKELEALKTVEHEREWLKSEYLRLNNLQEAMNSFETLKKAELEKEARRIDSMKADFEKEKLRLAGEIREKNHEVEMKRQMVEENQRAINDVLRKGEAEIKAKLRENEELRDLLLQERADMARKAKQLDERERDIKLRNDAVNKRMVDLERVAQDLDKQRKEINNFVAHREQAQKYTNEELVALFTKENEKLGTDSLYSSLKQSPVKNVEDTNPSNYSPFSIAKDQSPAPVKPILKNSASQRTLGDRANSLISENTVFENSLVYRPTTALNERLTRNSSASALKYAPRRTDSPGIADLQMRTTAKPREKAKIGEYGGGFNMDDYMSQLKTLERRRDDVVRYINYENQGLIKDKVMGETNKLNVLMGGGDTRSLSASKSMKKI